MNNFILNSFEKTKKELERMEKQGFSQQVIEAQKAEVARLQAELDGNQEYQARCAQLQDVAIKMRIINDETGEVMETSKHVAFVNNNRLINMEKVNEFIKIIVDEKYESAYPIIVCESKTLVENGYTVKSITGEVLDAAKAADYVTILDGQHRSTAFMKTDAFKHDVIIPNVHMKNIENIGEYLVDINTVGNWDNKDRVKVAALIHGDDEFLCAVAKAVENGINISTAAQIYCGKKLSKSILNDMLKGKEYALPKNSNIDVPRGDRFIATCREADIEWRMIGKRYLIDGFNSHAASIQNEEEAFKALAALKGKEKLSEELKKVKGDDDFIRLLTGHSLLQ